MLAVVIESIDMMVKNEDSSVCITYDNDDPKFSDDVKKVKKHVGEKKYDLKYDFWTDGCNYASQDYIRARRITVPPTETSDVTKMEYDVFRKFLNIQNEP